MRQRREDGNRSRAGVRRHSLGESPTAMVVAGMAPGPATSWFLFIDDSGHDHGVSHYDLLAGVAIQNPAVRAVIAQLHAAEMRCFGRRYSDGRRELNGKVLLLHSHITTGVQIADSVSHVIS